MERAIPPGRLLRPQGKIDISQTPKWSEADLIAYEKAECESDQAKTEMAGVLFLLLIVIGCCTIIFWDDIVSFFQAMVSDFFSQFVKAAFARLFSIYLSPLVLSSHRFRY